MTATHIALDPLDALLDGTAAELDLPRPLHETAVRRYQDVGTWLAADPLAPPSRLLYPQGSFLLGTVVAPIDGSDIDLDFVLQEPVIKESITQAELKARVGDILHRQLRDHQEEPSAQADCHEGRRCWTLTYPRLHLDVLPAIPDRDALPTGILLTDRELRLWQHSDPRAYATWFEQRSQPSLLFKEARGRVEAVPVWSEYKSPLKRAVQVIKRHRDQFFAEDADHRPPSILITTLVARSYSGTGSVLETVTAATRQMVGLIESRNGVWWVANPVQPLENFADKWATHPQRAVKFFRWVEALRGELASITSEVGLPTIVTRLAAYLGEEPVQKAAEAYGRRTYDQRKAGLLRVASGTAALGVGAGIKVRDHGFYGA